MIKKVITVTIIICIFIGVEAQGSKTYILKKAGNYRIERMNSGVEQLYHLDLPKFEIKIAKKLYKNKPLKFYKRYKQVLNLNNSSVIKTKLKKNSLKVWGRIKYTGTNKKIKYKLRKYKFRLSKNIKFFGVGYGKSPITKKHGRKLLKKPVGLGFRFFVKKGKVYKVYINA